MAATTKVNDAYISGPVPMCIYTITHKETGRVYVGQTKGLARRRWVMHCAPSRKEKRGIVGAIKKHGKDAFVFAVIDVAETLEQLDHKERFWIDRLGSLAPSGFNLEAGGNEKKAIHESTKFAQRMARAAWLASNPDTSALGNGSRGRKRRPEEIEAIKRGLTGRPVSEETRRRIAEKQVGIPKPIERTLEMTKARMKGRTVVCEDGRRYDSFAEAAAKTGLSKTAIFHAATGKTKSCGRLRWWLEGGSK